MSADGDGEKLQRRAWELVRPQLEQRSRRWWDQLMRMGEGTKTMSATTVYRTGGSVGAAMARDKRARRLAALQFATCDVVDAMSADEKQRLRGHDELPADFLERVQRQAKSVARSTNW